MFYLSNGFLDRIDILQDLTGYGAQMKLVMVEAFVQSMILFQSIFFLYLCMLRSKCANIGLHLDWVFFSYPMTYVGKRSDKAHFKKFCVVR